MYKKIESLGKSEKLGPEPFRDRLKTGKFDKSKLATMESAPGKIVRITPVSDENPIESALKSINLLHQLRDKYRVKMSVDFVLGRKSGSDMTFIYSVADEISGTNIDRETVNKNDVDNFLRDAAELYCSLVDYLAGSFTNKTDYLWDVFRNDQYIYGSKKDEDQKHLFLIDTDPLYTTSAFNRRFLLDEMCRSAKAIRDSIIQTEIRYGDTLSKPREKLVDFIKMIKQDPFSDETIVRSIEQSCVGITDKMG